MLRGVPAERLLLGGGGWAEEFEANKGGPCLHAVRYSVERRPRGPHNARIHLKDNRRSYRLHVQGRVLP